MSGTEKIIDKLAWLLKRVPEQPKRFEREHIFHNILDYCGKKEALPARLDMIFHFQCYKKCLAHMRRRNPHNVDHWLAYIEKKPLQPQSQAALTGMAALYYPMVAYKDYVEKNYDQAAKNIEQSLRDIDALFEDGFELAILAKIEQNLNRMKIHLSSGDENQAIDLASDLLSFVYTGLSNASFQAVRLDQLLEDKEEGWFSIVIYYTDAVLINFMAHFSWESAQWGGFFEKVLSKTPWAHCPFDQLKSHYELLLSAHLKDDASAAATFLSPSYALQPAPFSLQYLVIKNLKEADNANISNLLDQYGQRFPEYNKIRRFMKSHSSKVAPLIR